MKKIPFEDSPSEKTPIDSENLNLMQENIEEAIQPIELVGVGEELPTTSSVRDKYFNKTDNKIYTANDINTWDNGSIPSKDNFYINKSDNTLFYFNGETLVNVGGEQTDEDLSDIYGQINDLSITVDDLFTHDNNVSGRFIKNGGYMKQYYSTIGDFNNAQTEGYYKISNGQGIPNAPYQGYIYGKLTVDIDNCTYDNNNWVWQTFIDTQGREYRRMRINGGEWQNWYLVSSVASDSFIKVKSDDHNEITFDTAFKAVKVDMATISTSSGNLSLSNNGIKIGKGISKIRATLKASWAEYQLPARGDRILYIYKNNTQVEKLAYVVSARNYEDMAGDTFIDVAEGDIIDMYVAVANPGTARFLDNTTMLVQGLK